MVTLQQIFMKNTTTLMILSSALLTSIAIYLQHLHLEFCLTVDSIRKDMIYV